MSSSDSAYSRREFLRHCALSTVAVVTTQSQWFHSVAQETAQATVQPPLIEQVRQVCKKLAPHGWAGLLAAHGLDIEAADLAGQLSKSLKIDHRRFSGFEDFAPTGKRGIEPGRPSHSLLYHALASPRVLTGTNGQMLTQFPSLRDIDIIENYVYASQVTTWEQLQQRFPNATWGLVVFSYEYRNASATPHRRYADLCFARTGVARVGNTAAQYNPKARAFDPADGDDPYAIRVMPARYGAFLAVSRRGDTTKEQVQRFLSPSEGFSGDAPFNFWLPVHKLFDGPECLQGTHLSVVFEAHHRNDKLSRIHKTVPKLRNPQWGTANLNVSPFVLEEGMADFAVPSTLPEMPAGVLIPVPHRLVDEAHYTDGDRKGELVTYSLPFKHGLGGSEEAFASPSLLLEKQSAVPQWMEAPKYVNARHIVGPDGKQRELGEINHKDVVSAVERGGYNPLCLWDYTADGWIVAKCKGLIADRLPHLSAYSIIGPVDFFPLCSERELAEHLKSRIKPEYQESFSSIKLVPLSDWRAVANFTLEEAEFSKDDRTVTAIVASSHSVDATGAVFTTPTNRPTYLPDGANGGHFVPGIEAGIVHSKPNYHLAVYRLGSPFPEDLKICAAQAGYWPGSVPDASRTFEPTFRDITAMPLSDAEIGLEGKPAWDGLQGPKLVQIEGQSFVSHILSDCVDYGEVALNNHFSVQQTALLTVEEYQRRIFSLARVYHVLSILQRLADGSVGWGPNAKNWRVLSYRPAIDVNGEVRAAQELRNAAQNVRQVQAALQEEKTFDRFDLYFAGPMRDDPADWRRKLFAVAKQAIVYVGEHNVIYKDENGAWKTENLPLPWESDIKG